MNRELREIYIALSNGELSRQQALEKIKAAKLHVRREGIGSLLATPVWQAAEADGVPAEFAERHVLLCGLSGVHEAALTASARCATVDLDSSKNPAERYVQATQACFERIRGILQSRPDGSVLVQIVAPAEGEDSLYSGLTALLRTASLENPHCSGQMILVPASATAGALSTWLDAEAKRAHEPLVRYDGEARRVLRWKEVGEVPDRPPLAFRDDGVYLITGGLGALGLLFAKEILERANHARVILTGRAELYAETEARLSGLTAQPGRVSYRRLDLGNAAEVRDLVAGIHDRYGQLDGILHCAGMIADNFILRKSADELARVLVPKVLGTYNLDQASSGIELEFFALFSSYAGAMGNVGQADYAAANAFMDRFAFLRNRLVTAGRRHGRTRSIDWPLWEAGGMAIDPASREVLERATGMRPMQTTTGIAAFHYALSLPHDHVLVGEGDLAGMRNALLRAPAAPQATAPPVSAAAAAPSTSPERLLEETVEYLRQELSGVLKLPAQAIDPQAALEQYGIDSILAMKLTSRLEQTFGTLSKTLFFEYQTIAALAEYFAHSHAGQLVAMFSDPLNGAQAIRESEMPVRMAPASARRAPRRLARPRLTAPRPIAESEPIAIIGLSGRYPEAFDVEAYWQNLREGKDCIVEVPKSRWDWREYFSEDRTREGHHYSKWGGFIEGVDEFDPLFFNISPKEARLTDPQERLFLQHAWMAIEDAGYTRAALQTPCENDLPGQVGVYVGVMYSEYQLFGAEASARGKRLGIVGSAASIANRVSYVLNLHGPSVTLDTMCSSSLTAIHLAGLDLKLGRTSMAIAGGVNVSIHPNKYLVLSSGQFISSDGHCQSFGEGGDGYIPGEGVGAVVLKRLSDAERDGDHIYAVIRGSALNHGGKTNGYTVPNPQAQAGAISRALAEARIDARRVTYIEAHGTGTKLGDPIEIAALTKAFRQYTGDTGFCLIGSAKSNIGHCESAAGIAGLTKVLLQMQHREVVPSLHSAQLNPHIDFTNSPFIVNQTLRPWEPTVIDGRELPRIAGISSFGAGGSNAHILLEEYPVPVTQPAESGSVAIVLSARTAEQVQEKARALLAFLRPRQTSIDLASVAYTLQVGREAMDERLAFVVTSTAQLVDKLQKHTDGEKDIDDFFSGQAKRNKEALSLFSADGELQQAVQKWIAGGKLTRLADVWVRGLDIDWSRLYGRIRPRRVSLPVYPFARERYWVELDAVPAMSVSAPTAARSSAASVLHPLLHDNTSDLDETAYTSRFSGQELFLKEHSVDGRSALPAAAYLEMARAAAEKASRVFRDSAVELRDVVWSQPLIALPYDEVRIVLFASASDAIEIEICGKDGADELILCQARAVASREPVPSRTDVVQLERRMDSGVLDAAAVYAALARMGTVCGPAFQGIESVRLGSNELLARLRLPIEIESTAGDYVLHPALLEGALHAAAGLSGEGRWLAEARSIESVGSMTIVQPVSGETLAWVRYGESGAEDEGVRTDVDLFDMRGEVCARMRGVSWLPAVDETEEVAPEIAAEAVVAVPSRPALVRREVAIAIAAPAEWRTTGRRKPAAVTLASPADAVATGAPSSPASRARIALTAAAAGPSAPVSPMRAGETAARLYDCGTGIFSIDVNGPVSSGSVASLLSALERAERESSLKVLLLRGIEHCFAPGRTAFNEAVERKLFARLLAFPLPVIAALPGDVAGAGFLAATLCDFMVCGESARYGYSNPAARFYPTAAEGALFAERFDAPTAQDFLYLAPVASGRELRAKGWTCAIVPDADVDNGAETLALTLATKSQDALRLLKEHLGRRLTPLVEALEPVAEPPAELEIAATTRSIPAAPASLHLDMPVDGVLVVRHERTNASALAGDLRDLFAALDGDGRYRAVVLDGEVDGETISAEALQTLYGVLSASPIPVAGVIRGDASGNAWVLGLLCDVTVHNRDGAYSAHDLTPTPFAAALFLQRFGNVLGKEILLDGGSRRGDELRSRVPALRIADAGEVLRAAIDLTASWTKLPVSALAEWKKQSAAAIAENVRDLTTIADESGSVETTAELPTELTTIPLSSSVVTLTLHPGGVAVVKMEDRQARNMFSDDFIKGVTEAFALIERDPALKVVILTGYDSYFAAGGTKESLLAIQEGKAKFTDVTIFQLPLECPLPVVAAVQGHALGAGWAMGMFADFVLLSEESRYVSPYMSYGFTPGAGATRILAEKIGSDLATESLFTAQYYGGGVLRERGLRLPILPRAEVLPAAMELARSIARAPRARLIDLKGRLNAALRRTMEETYRRELAMHEKTFVNDPETLRRIRLNFYGEIETRSTPVPATVYVQRRSLPLPTPAAGGPAVDAVSSVLSTLKTLLAAELQMRESDIDDDAQFVDLGLDSVSGVSWMRRINEKYQTSVEVTKVYSHPTLTQLAVFIKEEAEKLGTLPAEAPPPAPAPEEVAVVTRVPRGASKTRLESRRGRKPAPEAAAVSTRRGPEPIAVIGMAGQFPKARNLDEFWGNLAAGRNCISTIPAERWDVQRWYAPGDPIPGKTNSQWLGALDEYDRFDPLFFNISPTEALSMDPQQRVFLQACWHGIEDAGYDARALSGSRCGVFVGCAAGDYHRASRKHDLSAHGFTGGAMSILAARISYYLNLQGPCISIDTACSSSLVAIANACDSLIAGSSDLALAGGVYVMAGPDMHIRTAQAGMLSPDGTCYTFDQRANGFVPGEAVGVVLLKRLSDAVRDGDIVHCVIRGWGVNQDGRTNGITAPNPESQTRLEQEVYDTYGIDPEHIQLIEAHGTATKLGDPIEVEGLKQAFRKYTQKSGYCAIGSVKSNVGHCLTAAGIAGFLKLALALKEKQLPPTIHFERLNEHIDLTGSPFFINNELREWKIEGGAPRQAAVSSFGFSGTNAHIVVGEHAPQSAPRPVALTPMIVPLSAKTTPQLRQKAVDLLEFLRRKRAPALNDVAYTLQVGREPMDERLGIVAGSIEELAEKLDAYLAGRKVDGVHQGQAKRGRPATLAILGRDDELVAAVIAKCIAEKKLTTLAELWANGFELDWTRLHGEPKPRRTTLPLYPFAKERYWLEPDAAETAPATSSAATMLDSALPGDTSDLEEDRYSAEEGEGFDLDDDDGGKIRHSSQTRADEIGTVIAAPVWEGAALRSPLEFAERHVLFCDLPQLESLPFAECSVLRAQEGSDLAKRYSDYAIATFEKIRGILRRKPQGRVLLQIVAGDDGEQALLAGLTGMLRTAALENPQFHGQLLLVPSQCTAGELRDIVESERTAEVIIHHHHGERRVLRWQELALDDTPPPPAFTDGSVYLITGGLGALGILFTKAILEQAPQAHVVLTGRAEPRADDAVRLSLYGGRVSYRQVDLLDLEQVRSLVAAIRSEHGRIDGILHCAGMIADDLIVKKESDGFAAVLAPKVRGTYNLDQAARDENLEFFMMFSSVAGAAGNVGQADYACANGFMDQFAAWRNRLVAEGQRRGVTRAVNWPLWQEGGMEIDSATRAHLLQTIGVVPMQSATGFDVFRRSLVLPHDQLLVVEGTRPRIRVYLQEMGLFERPAAQPIVVAASQTAAIDANRLQQELKAILASVLRIDAGSIDAGQPFAELGLDSFLGAELITAINKKYGTALSHARLFDYATVGELAPFLQQELQRLPAPAIAASAPVPQSEGRPLPVRQKSARAAAPGGARPKRAQRTSDKVAIVGMSGRYPKAADLRQYWQNLVDGKNAVTEVPSWRWDVDRYYDPDRTRKDKTYSKWLGAIDDVDRFDPLFFRISPQEAEFMDPQHRLFLEESYKAFEDAGYSIAALNNRKCGVYLGISTGDYMSLLARAGVLSAPVTANSYAIAAARIAYYLNLKGPAISVDTACSSSLVAIHLACQALLGGEIDMALAGGVTLWLAPDSYVAMSKAGMFSPDGQCKTFDDSADGIVNGEGVGVVVLKRLGDAEHDGDIIHGVILGSGINQDGRTSGITAPSVNSQIELERTVYARFGIDPETIGYIETHGTGTKLGDPIELEALATVFGEHTARRNFCALGSVKSNIGHTTSAAGVAGLQKVLLSMRNRTLVPTLHVKKENTRFDFAASPFYVSREMKSWDVPPGALRRAAVSSFGFSGTNAHLVVEEYRAPDIQPVPFTYEPVIVPLSARTPEALRQRARDLFDFIRAAQDPLDLASIAYTLQTGREAMDERVAIVVSSVEQLTEKLRAFAAGERSVDGVHQGRIEPGSDGLGMFGRDDDMQETIDKWVTRGKFSTLADAWARGLSFDWSRLYGPERPRRLSLPTYPFAKERCWFDGGSGAPAVEEEIALDADVRTIEDIINQFDENAIDTERAVHALKMLV